jgi:glycosyltransferase involved in cell wall biosynthesis
MNPPLISVITPTFNSGAKIAATVASVLSQEKGLYEFLVIDGGSTDGTLAHLRAQGSALRLLSEPDEGVYDAMNKGIRLTSGEFLYFLGAGDRLLPAVLEAVAAEIRKLPCLGKSARATLLYGNVDWTGYGRPYDGRFNRFKLLHRNICHQAIFYQRSVFERLGYYNTKYPSLADWEFNIRCFNDQSVHKCYIPLRIADYEGGGKSYTMPDLAFLADFRRIIRQQYNLKMTYHSPARGDMLANKVANKVRSSYAELAVSHAREVLVKVGFAPAWRQIVLALRLSHNRRVIRMVYSFLVLWLRIMGSRLKRWMKSKLNTLIQGRASE